MIFRVQQRLVVLTMLATGFSVSVIAGPPHSKVTGVFEHSSGKVIVTMGKEALLEEIRRAGSGSSSLSSAVEELYYGDLEAKVLYPLVLTSHRSYRGAGRNIGKAKTLLNYVVPAGTERVRGAMIAFSWIPEQGLPRMLVRNRKGHARFTFNQSLVNRVEDEINAGEIRLEPAPTLKRIFRAYRALDGRDGTYFLIENAKFGDQLNQNIHVGTARQFVTEPVFGIQQYQDSQMRSYVVVELERADATGGPGSLLFRQSGSGDSRVELVTKSEGIWFEEFVPDSHFLEYFGLPVDDYFPPPRPNPCDLLLSRS